MKSTAYFYCIQFNFWLKLFDKLANIWGLIAKVYKILFQQKTGQWILCVFFFFVHSKECGSIDFGSHNIIFYYLFINICSQCIPAAYGLWVAWQKRIFWIYFLNMNTKTRTNIIPVKIQLVGSNFLKIQNPKRIASLNETNQK